MILWKLGVRNTENWILDLLFAGSETLRKSFNLSGIDFYLQNKRTGIDNTFFTYLGFYDSRNTMLIILKLWRLMWKICMVLGQLVREGRFQTYRNWINEAGLTSGLSSLLKWSWDIIFTITNVLWNKICFFHGVYSLHRKLQYQIPTV